MTRTNDRRLEREAAAGSPGALTLRDLVEALCDTGAGDRQVVAAAVDLLGTGRVRLVRRPEGQFSRPA